jgi:hypothetical protein
MNLNSNEIRLRSIKLAASNNIVKGGGKVYAHGVMKLQGLKLFETQGYIEHINKPLAGVPPVTN